MKRNLKYTTALSASLLISFFIPWINWSFFKFSGYDLPPVINSFYPAGRLSIGAYQSVSIAYLLYLIPLCCVLSIIRDFTGLRLIPVISEFLAGLILSGVLYYYMDRHDEDMLHSLSTGYYFTVCLSVLGLIVSAIFRNESSTSGHI